MGLFDEPVISSFSEAEYLCLVLPIAVTLLSNGFQGQIGDNLLEGRSLTPQILTSSKVAAEPCHRPGALPASRKSFDHR